MTFLNEYSQFLKTDFKLHPSAFLDKDSDEHTSLDQRKENQRITKALRRLFPIFDLIWTAQQELQIQLQETDYLEKSVFNEHGLNQYYKEAGKVDNLHKEFIKLIKKHSNEPIIKEYYEQFNEFNIDLFPKMFDNLINSDIINIVNKRAENAGYQFTVNVQDLINSYKGN